jgi:hypothetical protein
MLRGVQIGLGLCTGWLSSQSTACCTLASKDRSNRAIKGHYFGLIGEPVQVIVDGGWRNKLTLPVMKELGIPIVHTWNLSVPLWQYHHSFQVHAYSVMVKTACHDSQYGFTEVSAKMCPQLMLAAASAFPAIPAKEGKVRLQTSCA